MQWLRRFVIWLGAWSGLLLLTFLALAAVSGGLPEALTNLPFWASRALALAAFPAALVVSDEILPDDRFAWRELLAFLSLTAALILLSFLLLNYVGPLVHRSGGQTQDLLETNGMLFGNFRHHVRTVVRESMQMPDLRTIDHWFTANALVWQYDVRVAASALPFLFAWVGVLVGFWARMVQRRDLRLLHYWAFGLFLVMSTYLAGENSYELIVARAAGPVFFAGLFVFFIPIMLIGGLGWTAVLVIWSRQHRAPLH